ncbi:uncharacterized protein PHALS_07960 [Plasmopara halstedii]|uniref:Uncharacterized protein n=1 Tax=Plasmopara halstedii TaxID=4781 RepID=A0A0P1B7X0_PLAHL|nr:uncharacterized protein PHALS_07960 [Plasmopara halstedii]CEG50236.1 hypothetical protein PHALS_07960 [Plasmopara halstedii]|eukprot:XP_024586605.1 hypothetical protein PHALS_07960 [Plasmopara halstedii]
MVSAEFIAMKPDKYKEETKNYQILCVLLLNTENKHLVVFDEPEYNNFCICRN